MIAELSEYERIVSAENLGGKLVLCMQEHFNDELELQITSEQRVIVNTALKFITTALEE